MKNLREVLAFVLATLASTVLCASAPEPSREGNALVWNFPEWEDDTYVFLPACAYNGNRDTVCRKLAYPPFVSKEGSGLEPRRESSEVPALEPDGSGIIEVTSGDLATPCAGFYFPKAKKGLLVFTPQQAAGHNVGFTVAKGRLRIDYPANRSRAYRHCTTWIERPDPQPSAEEAARIVPRYHAIAFDASSVSDLMERFFRERKCLIGDPRARAPFAPTWRLAESFWNSNSVWNGVHYTPDNLRRWMPGWVGGMSAVYALAKLGGTLTRERCVQTLDYAVAQQAPSGFYYEYVMDTNRIDMVNSITRQPASASALVRASAEGLYYLLKTFDHLPPKAAWTDSARRCADAFVRLWERYGQIGQRIDVMTGDIVVGRSTSGAAAPAALAEAFVRFGNRRYLEVAEAILEDYCRRDLDRGVVYGGPGDALMVADSESAALLLESCVRLAEVTGKAKWIAEARKAAALLSTWTVSYAYAFPAKSLFGRLGINTVGAVFANVQNKHAAPGLCTASPDSLVRLAKLTGDAAYRELALEISSFMPQCVSTAERPMTAFQCKEPMEPGCVNERVNMSDWEGFDHVGEIFHGRCWCNVALLLALADVPEAFEAGNGVGGTSPITAGWENVSTNRVEWPAAKVVWEAPKGGLQVVREEGAEGDVSFANGSIRIVKRNDRGRIVVTAPAFAAEKGKTLRFFADVSSSVGTNTTAEGWLAAYGEKRSVWFIDKESEKWVVGGGPTMTGLANAAPGMSDRKYTHFTPDAALVTPAIVVSGAASESTWRNWTAEDLAAAEEKWAKHVAEVRMPDRTGDMQPLADFERALAADIDHVAEVRTVDGRSALFVDGAEVPPIAYKACEWNVKGRVTYAGKPLQRAGVRLGVINLRLGKLPTMDGPWSERGFDVQSAVETVRRDMRVGDASCFVLAIGTSAYPKFSEAHPDETWRNEDGSVVRGNSGSAIPDVYNDGGKPDPGDVRWPWMSYCSPAWQSAINRNVSLLVEELRRQGLLKRIVGVHFFGYHDGQFAVPIPDYSAPAKAAYEREKVKWAGQGGELEYAYFMKQIGFLALEAFSRHAKQVIGKPIVAFRWCMSPFNDSAGAYDVGAFLRSDAVDVIVPQPSYAWRRPGYPQGVRLPCQSLHRHRKLMMFEFDFRTWAALDDWAHGVVETKGLSQADDLEMWQTIFRKHAGIMLAQRMGWWFYDMGGGWFYPDGIVEDVRAVIGVERAECRVQSAEVEKWHPDAAIVVDELSMALYNNPGHPEVPNPSSLLMGQWQRTAASGVPYDFYHVDDLLADPSIAKRYKALALCGFLHPDASRRALMDKIASFGVKSFVVQPGGYSPEFFHDFVQKAGGYVATQPGVMQVDMNGNFLSVHDLVPGSYELRLPFAAKVVNLKTGEREQVKWVGQGGAVLRLTMSAGETCWFSLSNRQ